MNIENTPNQNPIVLPYSWSMRWLKGNEYLSLLQNYNYYSNAFGFPVSDCHPTSIYSHPESILSTNIKK
jgi:hypothetical protein